MGNFWQKYSLKLYLLENISNIITSTEITQWRGLCQQLDSNQFLSYLLQIFLVDDLLEQFMIYSKYWEYNRKSSHVFCTSFPYYWHLNISRRHMSQSRNQHWYIIILYSPYFIQIFLVFYLMYCFSLSLSLFFLF